MFMHNFLTVDLIKELQLYLYVRKENIFVEELVITDKKAEEVKDIIIKSFSHSGIPKVVITNGNFDDKGHLFLRHEFIGAELDSEYAQKTLEHIEFLWGNDCILHTKLGGVEKKYIAKKSKHDYNLALDSNETEDLEYAPTSETRIK
jgi:stage V sporulation protein R